ncbi:hypothetical protein [Burkholderia ubonensis]|uniref:hypothetical protein n=1 Tax=Burkholderia ubonensis TaxID=101571 RepID=UPI0012F8AB51|nr:hypothetical protein [Burkholderia ubonensis]
MKKQMLLQLPTGYIRQLSLANHLALAGCCSEASLRHSLNELIRVVYLSYFLWEAGYSQAPAALFPDAERAVDGAVLRAMETGIWRLVDDEANILKRIVAVHDDQLARVTGRAYVEARRRLAVLLSVSPTASPIRKRWVECAGASD